MSSTTFVNQQTVIQADWLNDVNSVTYDLLGNGTTIPASKSALLTNIGGLGSTNNLSDLGNVATARVNLGVTATGADTTYAYRANNLSDLASASTARTNLGLGTIATQAASNVSISGGSITGITDLAVADGGTGASTITANSVILGNGTSALSGNLVAPGTSGNVLTSNGTTWTSAAPATSGMTLLGTITPTAVNSLSLTSLTLTNYKALFIAINNINTSGIKPNFFINQTSVQTGGGVGSNSIGPWYGTAWIDLSTGVIGGSVSNATVQTGAGTPTATVGGLTTVTTASTAIYFRADGVTTFTAAGSFVIYGVK